MRGEGDDDRRGQHRLRSMEAGDGAASGKPSRSYRRPQTHQGQEGRRPARPQDGRTSNPADYGRKLRSIYHWSSGRCSSGSTRTAHRHRQSRPRLGGSGSGLSVRGPPGRGRAANRCGCPGKVHPSTRGRRLSRGRCPPLLRRKRCGSILYFHARLGVRRTASTGYAACGAAGLASYSWSSREEFAMLGAMVWLVAVVAFFAWAGYVLHKRTSSGDPYLGPEARGDRERRAGPDGGGGA